MNYEETLNPPPDAFNDGIWENTSPAEENPGWRKKFKCPRCGHTTVTTLSPVIATLVRQTATAVTVRCECPETHPGSNGKTGCGWIAEIKGP
jgi:hypothetical protein